MAPAFSPLRVALLVVVAISAVTAGGYVLLADESPRPNQAAIDNASERAASLDGFAATLETTVRQGNETTRVVRRVTARPSTGKYRAEAVSDTAGGYDLTVSNGSVVWLYDRENQTVRRIQIDNGGNATGIVSSGEYVERIMRAAFDDENETTSGVSALPMVSSTGREAPSGSLPTNESSLRLNASYLGTEETSGRETYVFELTQPDGEDSLENYSARVWIDTEWFVVLKQRTNFTFDGERFVSTTHYRNVSFDPELDEDSFQFDPPADANVSTVSGPSFTQYESRDALARDATMSVPDPDLPPDFEFEEGAQSVGERRSVTLQYTNGTASMSVTVSNETDPTDTEGTSVQIGDATGQLRTFGGTRLVSWDCEGREYAVIGSNVSNETVIDVAVSVGCE